MEEKVGAAERVLDLLIALLNTHTRMSKAQIRRAVRGYHGDARAFDRTFERDKDLLRSIGVPIVVERDAVHEDDIGYRIDLESYAAPGFDFTPEEIGVLSLATRVYNDAQWRSVAGRGVTKVRGLGPGTHEEAPPVTLTLRPPEAAFDILTEAITRRQEVRFDYTPLNSSRASRRVRPWRLLARNRGWYVIGFDLDRDAPRVFRLSRIGGGVTLVGPPGAFEIPDDVDAGELLTGRGAAPVTVTVAIAPERAQLLRAHATPAGTRGGRDLASITTTQPQRILGEIAGYGADVVLLGPAEHRDQLLAGFAALTEVALAG